MRLHTFMMTHRALRCRLGSAGAHTPQMRTHFHGQKAYALRQNNVKSLPKWGDNATEYLQDSEPSSARCRPGALVAG